jgi:hypothetical protein
MGFPITVFVCPDITDTVLPLILVTYRLSLAESKAIPYGPDPTRIGLPITVLV